MYFLILHENRYMDHNETKNIEGYTGALEQLTRARCFLSQGTLSLCRNTGLAQLPSPTLYSVLLVPFLKILNTVGAFYYLNLILIFAVLVVIYCRLHTRAPARVVFLGLLTCASLATLLRLTQAPLTNVAFLFVFIGLPVISFGVVNAYEHLPFKDFANVQLVLLLFTVLIGPYALLSVDIF